MKRIIIMAIGLLLVGTASFADNDQDSKLQESQKTAPNNTSKNYRDRHHRDTTAQDQSNAESDVDVTRNLRKAIMAKKGMSIDAQNVKIITENGVLTLKGPVDSEKEKELIGSMAKRCCGVRAFTNQLEVKGHNSQ